MIVVESLDINDESSCGTGDTSKDQVIKGTISIKLDVEVKSFKYLPC